MGSNEGAGRGPRPRGPLSDDDIDEVTASREPVGEGADSPWQDAPGQFALGEEYVAATRVEDADVVQEYVEKTSIDRGLLDKLLALEERSSPGSEAHRKPTREVQVEVPSAARRVELKAPTAEVREQEGSTTAEGPVVATPYLGEPDSIASAEVHEIASSDEVLEAEPWNEPEASATPEAGGTGEGDAWDSAAASEPSSSAVMPWERGAARPPEPLPSGSDSRSRSRAGPRGTVVLENELSPASPPRGDPHSSPELLGPAFPEQSRKAKSKSEPAPPLGAELESEPDEDDLGPWKPAPPSSGEFVEPLAPHPSSSELATSARPALGAVNYDGRGPSIEGLAPPASQGPSHAASGARPADDGWAGFDEESAGGWKSITGNSQVLAAAVPAVPAPKPRDTGVYEEVSRRNDASVRAHLVALAGPDEGKEIALTKDEIVVGRAADSDIVVADASVSRQHARLVREGGRYVLVDNRSGNGTFVAGQRVDRQPLQSGDSLTFGNVAFRFLEAGDELKPVDASAAPIVASSRPGMAVDVKQARDVRLYVASGMTLLLVVALAVGIVVVRSSQERATAAEEAFRHYMRAVEQFKQQRWQGAEQELQLALARVPGHGRAQRYLDAVGVEKRATAAYDAAVAARGRGDLGRAFASASVVVDSVFYGDKSHALLLEIHAEASRRIERARVELARGDAARTLELLKGLEFIETERPDLSDLRERAERPSTGRRSGSAKSSQASVAAAAVAAAATPAAAQRATGAGAIPQAQNHFYDGNAEEALRALAEAPEDKDAQALEAKIRAFVRAYENALGELRAKRAEGAIRGLKEALALEEKVGHGKSRYAALARAKLADAHYLKGISDYNADRLGEAYKSFREAGQVSSDHAPSGRMLGLLETKATELVTSAKELRGRDNGEARRLLKLAGEIVAPGSEVAKKVKAAHEGL